MSMATPLSNVREVDLTNATWYQGSRYSYPLRGEHTNDTLAIVDICKRKGTEPPPHVHHREHEVFVLLDADVEFQASADRFTGRPGAVAFLPSGIPHRFAVQQPWGQFLVIVTPAGFDRYLAPFSERATHLDEPPLPSGPPDIPALLARGAEFGIEFVPPNADLASFPCNQPDGLRPIVRQDDEGELLDILGVPVRVKLTSDESGGAMSIFVTNDPPRMGPPLHVHHKEDETFYVIEGDYRARVGGEELALKQGQIAFIPRGVPHTYGNAGTTPGKLLVITTPGGFEHFFRGIDSLCRAGKPSLDALIAVGGKHGIDFVGPPIFA
ncbi:MAG: cupin domain-containing protein [Candidatus Hydrogenedentes bacterium]|nr:cupin domain-containing protein [Candidatus Hydrogenedentota bacterium]